MMLHCECPEMAFVDDNPFFKATTRDQLQIRQKVSVLME